MKKRIDAIKGNSRNVGFMNTNTPFAEQFLYWDLRHVQGMIQVPLGAIHDIDP